MSGTISSSNPYKNDKEDNSLIQSTTTAGRYGRVVLTSSGGEVGASAAEGGTAGTANGNLVFYKGVLGTFTAVGTGTPLPVTLQTLIAGEDLIGTFTNIANNPSFRTNIFNIGTAGTLGIGTLVAAPGVGTATYVTGFYVAGDSSALGTTEVCLGFGTAQTGAGVIFRGVLNTLSSSAAISNLTYPVTGTTTNTSLVYTIISGAGSVAWGAYYYLH